MCEQPFEYGEEIEVWNNPSHKHTQRFLGISAKGEYLTIPKDEFSEPTPTCRFFRNARRPLPNIKPGHPIMVRDRDPDRWLLGWFRSSPDGVVEVLGGVRWDQWKLLPNYDYTQPPPIEI